jgi:hypothetical protein
MARAKKSSVTAISILEVISMEDLREWASTLGHETAQATEEHSRMGCGTAMEYGYREETVTKDTILMTERMERGSLYGLAATFILAVISMI